MAELKIVPRVTLQTVMSRNPKLIFFCASGWWTDDKDECNKLVASYKAAKSFRGQKIFTPVSVMFDRTGERIDTISRENVQRWFDYIISNGGENHLYVLACMYRQNQEGDTVSIPSFVKKINDFVKENPDAEEKLIGKPEFVELLKKMVK